jgi:hypothetical protein
VSISFYEGVSLLTHGLGPGRFCTPATEAILKQLLVQLGQNFKGLQIKVTAAKKYTKIQLCQAQGDAYLLFRCLS